MFIDAREFDQDHIDTDICIVGGGAAGIAIANEFIDQKLQVCILESGGLENDFDTQMLAEGPSVGLSCGPLVATRLRYWGGTTNHWGGYCRAFSEQDFLPQPGIPLTGWPMTRSDLDPFYKRARKFLHLRPDMDLPAWEKESGNAALPVDEKRIYTRLAQIIWPGSKRRLGKVYLSKIKAAKNIQVLLNANLTKFVTNEDTSQVTSAHFTTMSGKNSSVRARQFILATGGIENARLLLLSRDNQPNGLGNMNDLVGRYFMEHARFVGAIMKPTDPNLGLGIYKASRSDNSMYKGYLSLTNKLRQTERLGDIQVKLSPRYQESYSKVGKSTGFKSLRQILDNLKKGEIVDDIGDHLGNVLQDIDRISASAFAWTRYRGDYPLEQVSIFPRIDQVPNAESRVTLATDVDRFNLNKAQLDWRLTNQDKQSALRTLKIIGAEFGRLGIGRMKLLLTEEDNSWPSDIRGGWHHMGTTRMDDNPKLGVVDQDCRVHGINNLHIAGSSVFPTGGSGTPTFTLIALALKLADHIKVMMK